VRVRVRRVAKWDEARDRLHARPASNWPAIGRDFVIRSGEPVWSVVSCRPTPADEAPDESRKLPKLGRAARNADRTGFADRRRRGRAKCGRIGGCSVFVTPRIKRKENTRCNRSSSFSFASSVSVSPYSFGRGFAACHYEFRARHSDVMLPRNIVATPTRDAPSISRLTREATRYDDAQSDANWPLSFHHFAHRESRLSRDALQRALRDLVVELMKSLVK